MGKITMQLGKIISPPDKVRLMYQAISEGMKQKLPIQTLTVSEITRMAGIGKGTAYEYFSSKEELLAYALLYECNRIMQEIEKHIFEVSGFIARLNRALNWLYENRSYQEMLTEMLRRAAAETEQASEFFDYTKEYLKNLLARLMQDGIEEGVISEADPQKQMLSATSMVFGFLVFVSGDKEDVLLTLEETKSFLIRSMIRSLS